MKRLKTNLTIRKNIRRLLHDRRRWY